MNKNSKLAMLNLMALSLSGSIYVEKYNELFGENHNEKKHSPKPIKKIIPKGMKEFVFGEEIIYAINVKNAVRKAKKMGLI